MSLTITVNPNGDVTYADADTGMTCVFQTTESWYNGGGFGATVRQRPGIIGYMRMDGGGDVLPPPAPAPIETGRRVIVVRD